MDGVGSSLTRWVFGSSICIYGRRTESSGRMTTSGESTPTAAIGTSRKAPHLWTPIIKFLTMILVISQATVGKVWHPED